MAGETTHNYSKRKKIIITNRGYRPENKDYKKRGR